MPPLVLVRYGELALKSPPVRREFESTLRRNILDQFARAQTTAALRSDRGHLYVEVDRAEDAVKILKRVFGVTSVSVVEEVPSDRQALLDRFGPWASSRLPNGATFAVRARRTGTHPYTSQELARDLGELVLTRFSDRGLTVDLGEPDVELFVEVRGPRAYLYSDRVAGPGGLPLGVAGRLVALVDGPRGALGAYLMMKRGCRVSLVCPPSGEALAREVLVRFDPKAPVRGTEGSSESWRSLVHGIAEASHADGVVLPIGVDDYPAERAAWTDLVLFSPTVGLTDTEVAERWERARRLAS